MEIERQTNRFLPLLEEHLRKLARNLKESQSHVTFNWLQLNQEEVVLEDASRIKFKLNFAEVESFLKSVGLASITHVTAERWQLDMRFNMMHLVSMRFESTYFVVHTKDRSHQFDGPLLTFGILPQPLKFEDLSKSVRGYITRIGKRAHIAKSEYSIADWPNLLRFVPQEKVPFAELADIQRKQQIERSAKIEVENKDHLDELNDQGLRLLNKVHKIITRRELYDFVKGRELTNPPDARAILRIVEEAKEEHHSGRR